ncbi:MAG: hypothetical protein A4E63_02453 [Syntrophorhabdus sp. PtaU1.Bin050]|nr:MAG: hypothetical protein A4E63_02453 [Syntrophorhabdus sp. PtaU1.Bin050]
MGTETGGANHSVTSCLTKEFFRSRVHDFHDGVDGPVPAFYRKSDRDIEVIGGSIAIVSAQNDRVARAINGGTGKGFVPDGVAPDKTQVFFGKFCGQFLKIFIDEDNLCATNRPVKQLTKQMFQLGQTGIIEDHNVVFQLE